MAKEDPQALAERLFVTFLAPLVLGGEMRPQKPFGGKNAFSIGEGRAPIEQDLLSRTQLARVRVARKLVPIDRFEAAPSGHEWAIAAMLHDLVQAAHPGFDAVFRRSGPKRLLEVIDRTLERIPPPAHAGEALSRHSWFSRLFELTRTDVQVKWWTGSETFLGEEPPARLTAWPELRRVQQLRTPRPLMDLPTSGAAVDLMRFSRVVENILTRTPLTDLATLDRAAPLFVWRRETLALCGTSAGRTLVLRALALLPDRAVDGALGRATRQLFAMKAPRAMALAVDLLRDRALAAAEARIGVDREVEPLAPAEANDASFAVSVGALAASHWIAQTGGGFAEEERTLLLRVLRPAATSPVATEVRALMGG
ncbi:MAG: hypothetical protein JWP97_4914 [Labilithrix sp.]|nr:hypothetical protein [Labilithrix sp.]